METNILKNEKNEIEAEIENMTLAEILKTYLNKDSSVTFVAWKREHPTKKPILKLQTKGKIAKKAIDDAINAITKDLDEFESNFKKLK
jgi:DNA-directed RNA polymerase subunit L